MRIATRVGLGLGIVCAVSAAALGWQWSRINRLAEAQRDLARVKLPTTEVALNLLDLTDLIEIRLRKYQVTRDPEYAAAARRACQRVDASMAELAGLGAAGNGGSGLDNLLGLWSRSSLALGIDGEIPSDAAAAWADARREAAPLELQPLRHEISLVLRAAREGSSRLVSRATAITVRALNVSGATLAVVLAISAAVTLVTVRSINRPLRELLTATQAVADGRFGHRIEVRSRTELALLAEHFNSMVRRLDDLDRLKRDFLSNVSHEIKTPLVALQESTRLLLDQVPGPLSDKQRRILELQRDGQDRLRRMISDLLDMSRLEAGVMRYSFEDFDLKPVVERALQAFEAAAAQRGVRLEVSCDGRRCDIRCDSDRVTQVIHNLVENALRHSPSGGTVAVRVGRPGAGGSGGDTVRVTVSDQGSGVPDEDKHRVFERFYQAEIGRAGAAPRSFGLGLTICERIVAAHGGRIWVEDAPGGGAAFAFELPAAAARPDPAPAVSDEDGSA
ncbi:MAG TPA: HAMP domain-containing sensor histidine kinase [Thermoanaerobaculales bacterium]|nr:HAMP domain-containing sensor histidine kinase [Thermoanaerobaculales bacterium]HQL31498.1 HAMP domain-containing sensor histidine kinase [Thermoanaerobaculales bacterium]